MCQAETIFAAAREHNADVIGISGLITPSLEEMTHVAKEMERQGFDIPLMIGGATTSKMHTAVKIAPHYKEPVVYVADASRSVGVVSSLLSETLREPFLADLDTEYAQYRERFEAKMKKQDFLRLEIARSNKLATDWAHYEVTKPAVEGVQVIEKMDLRVLAELIDWTPFFHTWQLRKKYPQILEDKDLGEEATKLFDDAHDDYNSIMAKAIADRFAEAFAEYLHREVRTTHWGYMSDESLSTEELVKEQYRGIRPAPGYPANPDHTQKEVIWDLLKPLEKASIELTDSWAMLPAASVSGWYFSHPESQYFGVGKLNKDQVAEYAERKGMTLGDAETLLSPNLGYVPAVLTHSS